MVIFQKFEEFLKLEPNNSSLNVTMLILFLKYDTLVFFLVEDVVVC